MARWTFAQHISKTTGDERTAMAMAREARTLFARGDGPPAELDAWLAEREGPSPP